MGDVVALLLLVVGLLVGRVEGDLLGAIAVVTRVLADDTHEVEVVLVVGDKNVHVVDVALAVDLHHCCCKYTYPAALIKVEILNLICKKTCLLTHLGFMHIHVWYGHARCCLPASCILVEFVMIQRQSK